MKTYNFAFAIVFGIIIFPNVTTCKVKALKVLQGLRNISKATQLKASERPKRLEPGSGLFERKWIFGNLTITANGSRSIDLPPLKLKPALKLQDYTFGLISDGFVDYFELVTNAQGLGLRFGEEFQLGPQRFALELFCKSKNASRHKDSMFIFLEQKQIAVQENYTFNALPFQVGTFGTVKFLNTRQGTPLNYELVVGPVRADISKATQLKASERYERLEPGSGLFERKWIFGNLTIAANGSRSIDLPPLKLKPALKLQDYTFRLISDGFVDYFELVTNAQGLGLRFGEEFQLGPQRFALELFCKSKNAPRHEDSMFIFLEQQQISVQENYTFNALPFQVGTFGTVKFLNTHQGTQFNYELVVGPELQEHIDVNARTGELSLQRYLPPGFYKFLVIAGTRRAAVKLHIPAVASCNQEQNVTVTSSLIVRHIPEEQQHELLSTTIDGDCRLIIDGTYPHDEAYVYINSTNAMLTMMAIDRESDVFRNTPAPQLKVRLRLICGRNRRRIQSTDFVDENIPYKANMMVVHIHLIDINDNPPRFITPESGAIELGYAAPSIRAQIFQAALLRMEAEDADLEANAVFSYQIVGSKNFHIEEGKLYPRAEALLDQASESFTVRAVDSGGLYTELAVRVRLLEAHHYALLTVRNSTGDVSTGDFELALAHLEQVSGYQVQLVRQAVLSEETTGLFEKKAQHHRIIRQAWIYAFANETPITSIKLQEKCREASDNFKLQLSAQSYEAVFGKLKPAL